MSLFSYSALEADDKIRKGVIEELNKGSVVWSSADSQVIETHVPTLRQAASLWTELAATVKDAVEAAGKQALDRLDLDALHRLGLEIVRCEKSFWQGLRDLRPF